jgi:hypothetical protein
MFPQAPEFRFRRAHGTRICPPAPATEVAGYYQWSPRDLLNPSLSNRPIALHSRKGIPFKIYEGPPQTYTVRLS